MQSHSPTEYKRYEVLDCKTIIQAVIEVPMLCLTHLEYHDFSDLKKVEIFWFSQGVPLQGKAHYTFLLITLLISAQNCSHWCHSLRLSTGNQKNTKFLVYWNHSAIYWLKYCHTITFCHRIWEVSSSRLQNNYTGSDRRSNALLHTFRVLISWIEWH